MPSLDTSAVQLYTAILQAVMVVAECRRRRAGTTGDEISSKYSNIVLGVCALALWAASAVFFLTVKSSFFDDAFIYLHVANNVVELGSARYFPVADSAALLASSPLRLLIMVVSVAVTRLFEEPRTIEAARLSMWLGGVIATLIFFPFFRRNVGRWLAGVVAAGLLSLTTETGLQMDGLLLFWCVFTLIFLLDNRKENRSYWVGLGMVVGLLVMTRPEYGLPAVVGVTIFALLKSSNRRNIGLMFLPMGGIALIWIALSAILGVYPIPTTYISKALTLDTDIVSQVVRFSGKFGDVIAGLLGVPAVGAIVLVVLVAGLIILARPLYGFYIASLLITVGMLWNGPGHFIWYQENVVLVFLTIALCELLRVLPQVRTLFGRGEEGNRPRVTSVLAARLGLSGKGLRALLAVELVVLVVVMGLHVHASFMRNRNMFWNFRADRSRGLSYQAIAGKSIGKGVFDFGDRKALLVMYEIGIVSYFAGNDVWMWDRAGLAQPGVVTRDRSHPLMKFYPESIFRIPEIEIRQVYANNYEYMPHEGIDVIFARGNPADDELSLRCDYYYPEGRICLTQITRLEPVMQKR